MDAADAAAVATVMDRGRGKGKGAGKTHNARRSRTKGNRAMRNVRAKSAAAAVKGASRGSNADTNLGYVFFSPPNALVRSANSAASSPVINAKSASNWSSASST